MRLSDKEILQQINNAELIIVGTNKKYPFDVSQIQPCSIDLRLDNKFYKFKDNVPEFDIRNLDKIEDYIIRFEAKEKEKIIIKPHEVLFGQIYEQLRIPQNCSGMIVGRSRFARLGLSVHATGGFINPGWEGAMPLQIINNNNIPISIYPFISVCQLLLTQMTPEEPILSYSERSDSPYQKEIIASPSILHKDPALNKKSVLLTKKEREKNLINKYLEEIKIKNVQKTLSPITNITNSTIGIYNMGNISNVEKIETSINQLKQSGANNIAESIQKIKDAILQSQELDIKIKEEVLDQLTEISEQANLPEEKRSKKSVLKAILIGIGTTLNSIGSLAEIWGTWGANISAFFRF